MATSNNSISGINNIEYFEDKYITFGKYSGKSYEYIYRNDKSYCKWLKLNIKNPNRDMIKFFEFLDSNKEIIKSCSDDVAPGTFSLDKRGGSNNIDYIIDHFEFFKYFRENNISFGKYLGESYEYIYLKCRNYCSWMEERCYLDRFSADFVSFLLKYKNEKFIFPDNKNIKILLFNDYICLNKILNKFNDIYSVFFTINFYKKNNSNIIVYFKYSYYNTQEAKLIFFDKNKNTEIFTIYQEFHTLNFSFSVNKNLSESNNISKNLYYDFYGILKYQFNKMILNIFSYSIKKYNEYINNLINILCKKYLNEDIMTTIEEYL